MEAISASCAINIVVMFINSDLFFMKQTVIIESDFLKFVPHKIGAVTNKVPTT